MSLFGKFFSAQSALKGMEPQGELPRDKELFAQVWKIAWPASIESFLVALASFVDSRMVSKISPTALAQVNITSEPRLVCAAIFTGLGIAVSATVAKNKGEGNRGKACYAFRTSLIVCAVLTVIISLLCVFFADGIITFAGSKPETHDGAVTYFTLVMGFFAFTSFATVINAALRGAGDSKTAMWGNITCNIVNLVVDWLLIDGKFGLPALGVRGAAIGLAAGTAVGLIISVASLLKKDCWLKLSEADCGGDKKAAVMPLWKIGKNTVLEQFIMEGGILIFSKVIASTGTYSFTAHSIGMKVLNISFSFGSGLGAAAVALVGLAIGEKRNDLARIYGVFCQRIGLVVALCLSCTYVLFGKGIVSLLSSDEGVIHDARILLYIMTVLIVLQITQLTYSGCLRGCGDANFCKYLSLFTFGVLRPGLAFLVVKLLDLGLYGAWACLVVDQIMRVVCTSRRFFSGKWAKLEK